jgi:hypothetical protein
MPSSFNSWNVSYSSITFFENALRGHSKVKSFRRTDDIVFEIELENGQEIKALLVNEYTLGLAAILRAQREFPGIEYVVTCADWNGYTFEAKEYGKENDLGVFTAGEFLGALNWSKPKTYAKKDSNGHAIYHYKSS